MRYFVHQGQATADMRGHQHIRSVPYDSLTLSLTAHSQKGQKMLKKLGWIALLSVVFVFVRDDGVQTLQSSVIYDTILAGFNDW